MRFTLTTLLLPAICALSPVSGAADASRSTLVVAMSGFRNASGKARLAVFQSARGFPGDAARAVQHGEVAIAQGRARFAFRDLPAGQYAVVVLHDENDNHKLDKNLFGVPSEGYGVSNNVRPAMRAPTFQEAEFEHAGTPQTIAIQIRY